MPVHQRPPQCSPGVRQGFSMIELIVVIFLIVALSAVAFGKYQKGAALRSAIDARDTYVWLGRRARAAAVQRGRIVRLRLDPATASGFLYLGSTGTTVLPDGTMPFDAQFGVTVSTSTGSPIVVCYSPRGFALSDPCSTAGLPKKVTFTRGGQSARATVEYLGQVEATP